MTSVAKLTHLKKSGEITRVRTYGRATRGKEKGIKRTLKTKGKYWSVQKKRKLVLGIPKEAPLLYGNLFQRNPFLSALNQRGGQDKAQTEGRLLRRGKKGGG